MKAENSELSYGGFWGRFAAAIVDTLAMLIVLFTPMAIYYGEAYFNSDGGFAGPLDFLVTFVAPIVITIHTGNAITTKQAIIRYLGYLVSALPLGLGFLWIAFDQSKRGWHDMMAGTVVIKQAPQVVTFDSANQRQG